VYEVDQNNYHFQVSEKDKLKWMIIKIMEERNEEGLDSGIEIFFDEDKAATE
jgi:hypothetical protein